jgi:alpha-glucosidase
LDQPGVHELMKELRTIMKEYEADRMLVGEDENIDYLGNGDDELQLVFNFPLMKTRHLNPDHIRHNQKLRLSRLEALPVRGWACNTLGNHDSPRVFNRFGDGVHNAELARLSLALMLTLKGTPFLYNGEEIGMTDYLNIDPSQLRDTMATWYYSALIEELKVEPAEAARRAAEMTRDKNRTPMQWANAANGGFCPPGADPWLPVNPNYAQGINVEEQQADPGSLLNYYRQLLRLRRLNPALVTGEYRPLHKTAENYFAFLRKSSEQTILVVLNYSGTPVELDFSHVREIKGHGLRRLFSSRGDPAPGGPLKGLAVAAFEVTLAEVQ